MDKALILERILYYHGGTLNVAVGMSVLHCPGAAEGARYYRLAYARRYGNVQLLCQVAGRSPKGL